MHTHARAQFLDDVEELHPKRRRAVALLKALDESPGESNLQLLAAQSGLCAGAMVAA